jgi:cytochrome c biogenesis protein ResB
VIQADAFYRRSRCRASFALASVAQGLEVARPALGRHHYHTTTAQREGVEYLYGERYRWARWPTLVTHGAVVLLVVALLLRGSLAWRELRVQLVPGQVYTVGHNTPWEVRLDRLSDQAPEDGQTVEYRAHLTLLAEGQPVVRHQVGINYPLSYRGLRVYLFSYGPTAHVRVDLVHDPSFLPAIAAAALMVGGLSCTFAFPACQLWARIAPGEMWFVGRASRDILGFEQHFRRLAQEVEAQLARHREDAGDG